MDHYRKFGERKKNINTDDFFIKDIKRQQLFVDLRELFTEYGLNITESETVIDRIQKYLDRIQK